MRNSFKKIFSISLAFLMTLSAFSVLPRASAEEEGCGCGYAPSIVIPGVFQSDVRYYDKNGNEVLGEDGEPLSKPFFIGSTDEIVKQAIDEALLPLAALLTTQHDYKNRCAEAVGSVLGSVIGGKIYSDSTGKVVNDVRAVKYNTSLANLSEYDREYALDQIPLQDYAEIAGLDHLYFYSYMSFGNVKECAEEVYELIQIAKKETGHDKVNIVPVSQGGTVFNALIQYYADNDLDFSADVNRVCFIVPACDGAVVLGDIYRCGLIHDDGVLYGTMLPSLMDDDQQWLAYLINTVLRIFPNGDLHNILDTAASVLIGDYLKYSTLMWALVPSGSYPEAADKYLSDPGDEYIREQTDWYYAAQLASRQNILDAKEAGVEFFDIVDYNYPLYCIVDSWDKVNGDGIIQLDSTSFGAFSAPVGQTFPEDYVQQNTYCTDPSHNHIDDERIVDASAGILCETTFYFKGQDHEATARNDVIIRLATRILTDESFTDVHSYPAYPQFNFARDSRDMLKLYKALKSIDVSSLSPEYAEEYYTVLERTEEAYLSTYMPTEDYAAIKADGDSFIYRLNNGGKDKPAEEPTFVISALYKIFRWYSDFLLKILGGKGFSDIFSIKGCRG